MENIACAEAFVVAALIWNMQTGAVEFGHGLLLLQLTKLLPAGGMAVSVTIVPSMNLAEHVPPQLMVRSIPAGVPVIVPGLLVLTARV